MLRIDVKKLIISDKGRITARITEMGVGTEIICYGSEGKFIDDQLYVDGRAVHDGDERIIEESVIDTEIFHQDEVSNKSNKLKRKEVSVEENVTSQQPSKPSNEKKSRTSDADDKVKFQETNSAKPTHTIIPENINVIDMGHGNYGVRGANNSISIGTYKRTQYSADKGSIIIILRDNSLVAFKGSQHKRVDGIDYIDGIIVNNNNDPRVLQIKSAQPSTQSAVTPEAPIVIPSGMHTFLSRYSARKEDRLKGASHFRKIM
jgi:hypothetical protein